MNSIKNICNKENHGEQSRNFQTKNCSKESHQLNKLQEKRSITKTVHFSFRFSAKKQPQNETIELTESKSIFYPTKSILKNSSSSSFTGVIPVYRERLLCSGRGILVTLIIIVLIITAAAISAGIVFSVIKSESSITTASMDNENSMSTSILTLPTSTISIGSQSGSPCTSYTTINDPTRHINYTALSTCDRLPIFNATSDGSWIRFIGIGGTTIPRIPPHMSHCGAFIPAWHNGTLPLNVGDRINGTICYNLNIHSCLAFININIVNCGGFYVYLLQPSPFCSSRYCTV